MTKSGMFRHEDTALVLIDYQKEMFDRLGSETPAELVDLNVRLLIKAAKAFDMPIILSTVGVAMGVNQPTRQSILDELPGIAPIDRSTMNAWEDSAFRAAVKDSGRRRLIMVGLYTEVCLAFPVVDALGDGHDVAFVVDAVGGLTQLAHQTAIDRMAHAGAVPTTTLAMVAELFRDWASPVGDGARAILAQYGADLQRLQRPAAPQEARHAQLELA